MILLSCFVQLSSQEYSSVNYTISDGLPSNECYQVTQDNRGYIWVATDRGPARFDGKKFKVYGPKDGLPDPTVFRIHAVGDTVLFRCFNETIYALIGDSVMLLPVFKAFRDSMIKHGEKIVETGIDKNSNFTVGVLSIKEPFHTFYKFNKLENFRTERSDLIESRSKKTTEYKFTKDGRGIFGIVNRSEQPNVSEFQYIFPFNGNQRSEYFDASFFISRAAFDALQINPNHFLLIDGRRIRELKGNDRSISLEYKTGAFIPGSFSPIDSNTFIVGNHKKGITQLNKENGQWIITEHTKLKGASYAFVDMEKNTWISTIGSGIFLIPNREIKTVPISNQEFSKSRTVSVLNGNLWVGFANGKVIEYKKNKTHLKGTVRVEKTEIYDAISIKDRIWIGYIGEDTNVFETIEDDVHLFQASSGISSLTGENNLWYGGTYFVHYFNTKTKKKNKYRSPVKTRYVLEIDSNRILLATYKGVIDANIEENQININETHLKGVRVSYLLKTAVKDLFLVGTVGKGVLLYDLVRKKLVDQKSDFGGREILNVSRIVQSDNSFWIASNSGVSVVKVDPYIKKILWIKNYTANDGLPSDVVNFISFDSSRAYVATEKGVTYFDSSVTFINFYPPPVEILEALVFGDSNFNIVPNQRLGSGYNNIKISFAGLSYKSPTEVLYEYRLYGKSLDTVSTEQRTVSFLNLSPGDYKFEVYAINNSGVRSKKPATFSFTIAPPFYQTWWFYSLIVFAVGLIIYIVYKAQIKRLHEKNDNKIAFSELQQKALIAQMNPHFIFNSMNSILSLIMENKNEIAEDYLTKFSGLLRNALNQSDETFTSLRNEIIITKEYIKLEALRFQYNINCTVEIASTINQESIAVPSLILQTLAENSILHGIIPAQKDGLIQLEISEKSEALLEIKITDNGIGINASRDAKKNKLQTHQSKGTNILKSRLEALSIIHNVKCDISYSDTGSGTCVRICVPYSSEK